ncbi:MAG: patatin family protein [Actinomycetaceae bacterium]|nr:patatin family protein [Actinomycetaceae bacterium]
MTHLPNNVFDTALIFEGGGMRASYAAAIVAGLLREGIFFDYTAGISAGSSCVVNYVAREPVRARKSFVEIAADPNLGNAKTFLQGKGLFYSEYIYEEIPLPGGALPLDFNRLSSFGTKMRIGSFNVTTGKTEYWTEEDLTDLPSLMLAVRASSSLPILMPPAKIHGDWHVDGAIGENAGIALDVAERDGFEKFVFVLTQPRDYVKEPMKHQALIRALLNRLPGVADAMLSRPDRYNALRERIFELEKAGKAYVFWADDMQVDTGERDEARLAFNYSLGEAQFKRDLPGLKKFLGID